MPLTRAACLVVLTVVIALSGFASAIAAPRAAPAELDAFVQALPAPGAGDRPFLEVPAAVLARLAIAPATLRQADPGVACDPAAAAPVMLQSSLGRVGQLQTLCLPNGTSLGLLTLGDGGTWMTTCGHAGVRVTAWADVTLGERHLRASTEPDVSTRAPTHACGGWTKQPR